MSSLGVGDALANGIETTKTKPTRKDLKAYTTGQEDRNICPDEDKSNICTDTGASICVTGCLENTANVVENQSVSGCCVHHFVHKQAVDNEMLTLALHEDSLLAVDCGVAVLFHPVRDVNVPSAGCLSGSIDALEELKVIDYMIRQ